MPFTMKAGHGANAAPSPANPDSREESIRDLVRWLEMSWNSSASAGFATAFSEDADFITILGAHHQGRSSIEAGHRQIFDTIYKGSRISYTVENIRFLHSDIAVAFIHARLELQDGTVLNARPTLTLQKHGERWQIMVLQNTLIGQKPA